MQPIERSKVTPGQTFYCVNGGKDPCLAIADSQNSYFKRSVMLSHPDVLCHVTSNGLLSWCYPTSTVYVKES